MHPLGGGDLNYTAQTLKSDKILLKVNLKLIICHDLATITFRGNHIKDLSLDPASLSRPESAPQSGQA